METKYQLIYDTEWELYVLTPYPQHEDDISYSMLIRHIYGRDEFRFIMQIDGEMYYLNTQEEFEERVADIREFEGDEVADLWSAKQNIIHIVHKGHFIFEAKKYWEAITLLTGLTLSTSFKGWPKSPLDEDLIREMDVLRQQELEKDAE